MSTNAKLIIWIVVAIVVIGGIWWWHSMSGNSAATTATIQTPAQVPPTTPTSTASSTASPQTPPANNIPGVSATDSSNAALQADLSNIDAQMNQFGSDNSNITSAQNDQQSEVQQSQL